MVREGNGIYTPHVVQDRCNQCHLCARVCPAAEFNPAAFEHLFGPDVTRSVLLGRYLETWTGRACDEEVRYNATSGGIATATLSHMLASGLVDAAVVVRVSQADPLVPEAIVARDSDAIRSAMGSKYAPVPVGQALREVRNNPGRYAFVGLPCHIRGIRTAMKRIPSLAEHVRFVIGLVCAHTMLPDGFAYLVRSVGAEPSQVQSLTTWGAGWPGGMTVRLKDGSQRFLPRLHSLFADVFGSHLFTPHYCFDCPDLAAELADVVLADAWLPSVLKSDRIGASLVMARTETGRELMRSAQAEGAIVLESCQPEAFARSQRSMLYFKKRNLAARQRFSAISSRDATRLVKPRLVDYPLALTALLARWYGERWAGTSAVQLIPPALIRLARTALKVGIFAASRGFAQERPPRRVVITNQHTDNRGDQAALWGMLSGLRKRLKGYHYQVLVQSPDVNPLRAGQPDVESFGMLTKHVDALRAGAYVMLHRLGLPCRWLLRGHCGRVVRAYQEAELVVSAPGGPYFGDLYGKHEYGHLFHVWLAQTLGKPTVLFAPSAGPFTGVWRNAIRRSLLSRMDVLCVREEISRDNLLRLGIPSERVQVVPDAALNYSVERHQGHLREVLGPAFEEGRHSFGFTPCQWRYPGDADPDARQKEYVTALARVLDRCVEEYDSTVVAFPQLFGRHTDLPFIERVRSEMRHSRRCHVFPSDRDCLEQQAVIGQMDMFIATRYHSQVFAAKMGVPSVCVAYEHKARGFMRLLGLERHVLDIEDMDEGRLWEAVKLAWQQRDAIRSALRERIPLLAEAADRAPALCVGALSSLDPGRE